MMIKKRLAVLACMALMAAGSMVAEAENRLDQKAVLGGTIHSVVSSGARVTEGTVLAEVGHWLVMCRLPRLRQMALLRR